MIDDGALEDVEAIFAVHVAHTLPTSVIGSRPGPFLAGSGFFKAVISGKEGRAWNPHSSIDPVLAASASVISLQSIVSREANPLDSQVYVFDWIFTILSYNSKLLVYLCVYHLLLKCTGMVTIFIGSFSSLLRKRQQSGPDSGLCHPWWNLQSILQRKPLSSPA